MTKKDYLKPTMQVFETYIEEQILAGSVTSVIADGLGVDLSLDGAGDSWEEAASRNFFFASEE